MVAHRTFDRERTAMLILEALELGLSPFQALLNIDDITPSQARYQIRTVQSEGLLGRPPHRPIHARPRPKAPQILLCGHCYTMWPCPDAFRDPPKQNG